MAAHTPLTPADTIVRVCLLLAAAIALGDGLQQLAQGSPAGADNLRRFMTGVHIGWAPLCGGDDPPAGGTRLLADRPDLPRRRRAAGLLRPGRHAQPGGRLPRLRPSGTHPPDRHRLGALHRTQIQASADRRLKRR